MTYVNEGAEKAKQEEEVANRKRKVEQQTKWEGELHCSFSLSLISAIWRVLRVFQTGVSTPIRHYFSSSLMSARRTYADTMVFSCFFCFSFLFLLAFRRTTRRSDTSLERFQHEKAKEIEEKRACSWIVQARFTKNLRVPPLPIPLPFSLVASLTTFGIPVCTILYVCIASSLCGITLDPLGLTPSSWL